jgi:hypothetical protein
MAVTEGHCPRCAQPTNKIVEFINDPCVNPLARVEYQACGTCKKIWKWKFGPFGPEVTDMRVEIKKAQDDIDFAS